MPHVQLVTTSQTSTLTIPVMAVMLRAVLGYAMLATGTIVVTVFSVLGFPNVNQMVFLKIPFSELDVAPKNTSVDTALRILMV
jgi:hypothetical protein